MTDQLLEKVEDGVATLTLNNPTALNALTREIRGGLIGALHRHAGDRAIRAVVVTGAGRAFCAGGDVNEFADFAPSDEESGFDVEGQTYGLRANTEIVRLLHEMPKPTVAVIPGPAAGAGFSIAMACDFRIAAADAKLTTAFARVGLSGDYGGAFFLTQLVGAAKARELYLTADVITGAEAEKLGLVNKAVPEEVLSAEAQKLIEKLAGGPTIAMGYMKRNLNAALRGSLKDVLDLEALHMIRTFMTEDHKAAAKAYLEKCAPSFKGH